jgi:predicted nucleotidyltransferase
MYGLRESDLLEMNKTFKKFPQIEKVILFGSRAKGNSKNGSDVDICLIGNFVSHRTTTSVNAILNEETIMPYHFDVLNFNDLQNNELKEHIERVGKCIFDKNENSSQ